MSNENSIINSLKRLERIGSETSKATQKLRESAKEVADKIVKVINDSGLRDYDKTFKLPRNYKVTTTWVNQGQYDWDYLRLDDTPIHEKAGGFHPGGDFNSWVSGCDRKTILQFAEDIATGLLDEIADFLEIQKKKDLIAEKKLRKE